jgi:hypothetical protein
MDEDLTPRDLIRKLPNLEGAIAPLVELAYTNGSRAITQQVIELAMVMAVSSYVACAAQGDPDELKRLLRRSRYAFGALD